jgi:hypothetical protein
MFTTNLVESFILLSGHAGADLERGRGGRTRTGTRCRRPDSNPFATEAALRICLAAEVPGNDPLVQRIAAYLLSLGVHPKMVQDMLGHSSIALTLNTYSHVVPALHREAASQMERLLSGPAGASDGQMDAREGISSLGHPDVV